MSFWKKYRKLHIWLAVDLAVLGLYLALRQNRQLMNSFADHITTPLKAALGRLCALTSLSVMEILYALAAAVAVGDNENKKRKAVALPLPFSFLRLLS